MLNIKKITDDMISIDIEEGLHPLEEGLWGPLVRNLFFDKVSTRNLFFLPLTNEQ